MNTSDMCKNPVNEYFIEYKLDLWTKYCDIISDAHDKIGKMIVNSYMPDLGQLAIEKIAGNSLCC